MTDLLDFLKLGKAQNDLTPELRSSLAACRTNLDANLGGDAVRRVMRRKSH